MPPTALFPLTLIVLIAPRCIFGAFAVHALLSAAYNVSSALCNDSNPPPPARGPFSPLHTLSSPLLPSLLFCLGPSGDLYCLHCFFVFFPCVLAPCLLRLPCHSSSVMLRHLGKPLLSGSGNPRPLRQLSKLRSGCTLYSKRRCTRSFTHSVSLCTDAFPWLASSLRMHPPFTPLRTIAAPPTVVLAYVFFAASIASSCNVRQLELALVPSAFNSADIYRRPFDHHPSSIQLEANRRFFLPALYGYTTAHKRFWWRS